MMCVLEMWYELGLDNTSLIDLSADCNPQWGCALDCSHSCSCCEELTVCMYPFLLEHFSFFQHKLIDQSSVLVFYFTLYHKQIDYGCKTIYNPYIFFLHIQVCIVTGTFFLINHSVVSFLFLFIVVQMTLLEVNRYMESCRYMKV